MDGMASLEDGRQQVAETTYYQDSVMFIVTLQM